MVPRWSLTGLLLVLGTACSDPLPPDILLVTFDTTRADRIGCYGYEGAQTPTLDALAARGVLFEQAVSVAPVTLPSHATILTGLYPPAHGVRDNGAFRLPDSIPTLATRLQARGYQTGAFVAAYPLDSVFGLDRGFDVYDDDTHDPTRPTFEFLFDERSAPVVTKAALRWLEKRDEDRPVFLWVHYFDPHAPYLPPAPFDERFAGRPYDGEIAYADQSLGRLLQGLDERRGLERTLVAVTADHGESLGDHGEPHHGLFIYDATQRVPLILAGPGLPTGRRLGDELQARTVDIVPTLLEAAGAPVPRGLHGQSLLGALDDPNAHPRYAYLESLSSELTYGWSRLEAVRSSAGKYVHAPRPELYDLAADPGELEDIVAMRREKGASWKGVWEDTRRWAAEGGAPRDAVKAAGAETARRLQALGYLSASPSAQLVETPFSGPDPKDRASLLNPYQRVSQILRDGQPAEAIRYLQERIAPEDGDGLQYHLNMGQAYQDLDRPGDAVPHYQRLLELRPGDGFLWAKLADSLIRSERSQEAETAYRRSDELLPNSAPTLSNLAIFAAQRGETGESETLFERALKADPNHLEAIANLALLLEPRGDAPRLRTLLDQLFKQADEAAHASLLVTGHSIAMRLAERSGDTATAHRHRTALARLQPRKR